MNKFKSYAKKYFIDAMSAMALGLFASLLIGTIFGTVGTYLGPDYINNSLINTIGGFFTEMKGFAQGIIHVTTFVTPVSHSKHYCNFAMTNGIVYGLTFNIKCRE